MDEVRVSTVVYAPREEVFDFLVDLRGYPKYTKYLHEVEREGSGGPGTRYTMTFGWWRITYRAVSEVVGVDEPTQIDWRVVKDVDAHGHWQVTDVTDEYGDATARSTDESVEASELPTDEFTEEVAPQTDREHATRIELWIEYDPDSTSAGAIDLPSFVSLDHVLDRVVPLIYDEAERVLRRIVADLEGEPREVELRVHDRPGSI